MKKRMSFRDGERIVFFSSFEEENAAEYRRYGRMSLQERLHEVAILQERVWGKWTGKPMKRVISFERVDW